MLQKLTCEPEKITTTAAPAAVRDQVNKVPNPAWTSGLRFEIILHYKNKLKYTTKIKTFNLS